MLLKKFEKGYKHISCKKVKITDPCYKDSTWCTMDIKLPEDNYRFIYYKGAQAEPSDFDETPTEEELQELTDDISSRNFILEIQKKGCDFPLDSPKYKKIGEIGVDSGTAGFFWNKPDLSDDTIWESFYKALNNQTDGVMLDDYGWYSWSGYGDGMYDVFAIKENDKIIAVKVCF